MAGRHFNLVTKSWIKVVDENNQEKQVSLQNLFKNAVHYRQLAGEMKAQDLAILRFLIAILTTVYSRFNDRDESYSWLEIDPNTLQSISFDEDDYIDNGEKDLLNTWQGLYHRKTFSPIVIKYLQTYLTSFDLFDTAHPFYQVTRDQYDSLVPANKVIAKGKGTVAIKQLNRTISESNNSPDIFLPKTPLQKNQVSVPELVRWLITYQNYTAVTDKTKIVTRNKFSISKGWLYGLNSVFIKGKTLFDTLMLNLILINQEENEYIEQKPVWEYSIDDYIQQRKDTLLPPDLAGLYTVWSRIIHIEWDKNNQPILFSAILPKLESQDAFIEPMTTWKQLKEHYEPAVRSLNTYGESMWRHFGQYINTRENNEKQDGKMREPGIVRWLNFLKRKHFIQDDFTIHLATINLISDKKPSKLPVAEFSDEMKINADVLFDTNLTAREYWPGRIEEVIELTDKIGLCLRIFAKSAGSLKGLNNPNQYADHIAASFYEQLNELFYDWLANLTNHDERDQKINLWKQQIKKIVIDSAQVLLDNASSQEIYGREDKNKQIDNIFTEYQRFRESVARILKN